MDSILRFIKNKEIAADLMDQMEKISIHIFQKLKNSGLCLDDLQSEFWEILMKQEYKSEIQDGGKYMYQAFYHRTLRLKENYDKIQLKSDVCSTDFSEITYKTEKVKKPRLYTEENLTKLAKENNIKIETVRKRLDRGWSLEMALKTPKIVRKAKDLKGVPKSTYYQRLKLKWSDPFYDGPRKRRPIEDSLRQRALAAGMNYKMVWKRIKLGWSEQEALTIPIRKSKI